jgi:hypothetical protein
MLQRSLLSAGRVQQAGEHYSDQPTTETYYFIVASS